MNIALKEISECEYWLELLYKTDYISSREFESIYQDSKAITKLLMSIVKTTKENSKRQFSKRYMVVYCYASAYTHNCEL